MILSGFPAFLLPRLVLNKVFGRPHLHLRLWTVYILNPPQHLPAFSFASNGTNFLEVLFRAAVLLVAAVVSAGDKHKHYLVVGINIGIGNDG